jgi:hypothetical protein
MIANYYGHAGRTELRAFTVGAPTALKTVEIWALEPTNQGFLAAQESRIWQPDVRVK